MGKYSFPVPRPRGITKSQGVGDQVQNPSTNDIFLHLLFGRLAATNETHELNTKYDKDSNTLSLDIPDELLSLIETIEKDEKLKRFISWLISGSGGGGGSIGGSIAANQVAYGSGADEIEGSDDFSYDGTTLTAPPTDFAASTESKASVNLATGIDPLVPVEGDVWFTANAIRFFNGLAKVQVSAQVQKRTIRLRGQVMASVVSGAQSINIASQVTGTIIGWRIITDIATTASLDVWKLNGANPNVANTIVAAAPPIITAATYAASTTLTGWTTAIAVGDVFELNVDSNSAAKVITLELDIIVD